ncbi:MAG: phosphoglucomutase/phosphomannomutase family protein [Endomicrobiales bacterium]|nr:phosphoglucomutase/phosphomannomutase family protein [Endomicrobiales bacterium]
MNTIQNKSINAIRFGTDGWRAIIADQFTFNNVRRVASAIAQYAYSKIKPELCNRFENRDERDGGSFDAKTADNGYSIGKDFAEKNVPYLLTNSESYCKIRVKSPLIVVGYDTRFLSADFARVVAEVLSAEGCTVILSNSVLSTPALSSAVVSKGAFGGVMISASHNPASFNGIKFKTAQGCSAPESVTDIFEKNLSSDIKTRVNPQQNSKTTYTMANLTKPYLKRLTSMVDLSLIKKTPMTIVVDPLYGAGIGYMQSLLGSSKINIIEIHGNADPLFGGIHPEPIEHNLGDLKLAVKQSAAAAGLSTDGDADRIGVVDDKGNYLTPHQIFPLILYYLTKYKGLKGKVVQALSLGYLSKRIAAAYSLPFEEVPIGFKYIADRIMNEEVLIGGEESGGYGYGNYIPERDGILNSLVILEMLSTTKKSLSALIDEMQKVYGTSCYMRTDFVNPGIKKETLVSSIRECAPKTISGFKVSEIKDFDGVEFVLENDSWILFRPSGTEPVIRVYAESDNSSSTKAMIKWGNQLIKSLINKAS